jgi:hypothetical protein
VERYSLCSAVVYFDGDDVGARIELCLLRDDIDGAASASAAVTYAIEELAQSLRTQFNADVKFAAGDEVLAILPILPDKKDLDDLRIAFAQRSGVTISCGVGFDAYQAVTNLHYAKLLGKNLTHQTSFA